MNWQSLLIAADFLEENGFDEEAGVLKEVAEKERPRPAYFSERAARRYGTSIWLGENGEEVEVTAVLGGEESLLRYQWEDKRCVGMVTKHLRGGRKGEPESFRMRTPMFLLSSSF